ncbi:acetyl/propionyl/methylcrotonyl-CoA carboxylase subunit alpha [Bordetella sp. 15P40C-2]|uniref:acetyl-CoA carboxylase biotin carboxylase subunit n=1 Tax=Bordetella sp. 15P40C-2 TaxID=2572246 RepID=UPI0013266E65|nr:biotin carboxylase N-terminal domain-containing protein [Bordetella sp. 15P40C-2]MVW71194.1 ATP-grasp domain-containing protein [Bordetella sp. 15P40C-2]
MFRKVLVANRAAVADRVIRALRELGIPSVAVYSEADAALPYWKSADEAYLLGPAAAQASYLNQAAILNVARECGADALHPGYGFLSENADFADAVEAAGMTFIGPSPSLIRQLGHKTQARDLMRRHGMPMTRSSAVLSDADDLRQAANDLGFPLLIKPAGGGGGIGMLPIRGPQDIESSWQQARALAQRCFAQPDLYVEQLIEAPRHIEFQFLADRYGGVRCIFERDCSTQRRHQKVLEEAPAPGLDRTVVADMAARLEGILSALKYNVIGTVEMLYTPQSGFVFLEVNTRLQVEHAVTEAVTGIDLVHAQIRLAAGERISAVLPETISLSGHAVEARVYAEDPVRFLPSPGLLKAFDPPSGPGIRVETGYCSGVKVSSYYDPMLAKVIAHGDTRDQALDRLAVALSSFRIEGVKNNIPFLQQALANPDFRRGQLSTAMVERIQTMACAA